MLTTTALAAALLLQAAPPSEVARLYEIAGAPQSSRIMEDIGMLAGFGTRHTLSETESDERGIGAARRWIAAEFEEISRDCGGCLEVRLVSDFVEGERRIPERTEIVNVIAIQRGRLDPNRMVMMSGDIDSRASDVLDGEIDAPGANDNASGMAGVLEAARVLTQYEFPGTIVYAGLSGEEQGLFGGRIVAGVATEEGWDLKAVLNNDMIGNIGGIDGVVANNTIRVFSEGTRADETPEAARYRRYRGGEVDSPARNLARYIDRMAEDYLPNLDAEMIYRLDRFGRGGHQTPFSEVGIPAVRIMETHEHYDRQHQDIRNEDGRHYGDTIEYVDGPFAARATALNALTMAGIAGAPPFPTSVELEGAVQPSAKLTWEDGGENRRARRNLAGYRVYWRKTTDPQWTNSRFVGEVNEWTFENLVVDNYFFGVSAVAPDGSETPVVFPGPPGRFEPLEQGADE
ncbi:M20/M25/M40 family metallo-hydrolase [Parvularcula maris]|uniref:M28 family metallopeptidase n=1 Tax=Parvularcula maris TaxID=2965077 RepID=A0A9X2RIA1_9PROT|nr:M28 family metallopeptidase [Parvularcula maris]MCQ8185759.1 M28 family metallopeptidase [Parvularcula maris]